MRLVTVQDYAIHHKVSKQSVYARISSGSLKAVIQDNIKYIQDESRNEIAEDQEDSNIQSIEIKHLKKEIPFKKDEVIDVALVQKKKKKKR